MGGRRVGGAGQPPLGIGAAVVAEQRGPDDLGLGIGQGLAQGPRQDVVDLGDPIAGAVGHLHLIALGVVGQGQRPARRIALESGAAQAVIGVDGGIAAAGIHRPHPFDDAAERIVVQAGGTAVGHRLPDQQATGVV